VSKVVSFRSTAPATRRSTLKITDATYARIETTSKRWRLSMTKTADALIHTALDKAGAK